VRRKTPKRIAVSAADLGLVHKFVCEDQLAKVERLRQLGWNVTACVNPDCTECVPDTPENRLKVAALEQEYLAKYPKRRSA